MNGGIPIEEVDEDDEEGHEPGMEDDEGDIFEDEAINVSPTKKVNPRERSAEPDDREEEDVDEFSTNGVSTAFNLVHSTNVLFPYR